MANKFGLHDDTFEQLLELGKSTVKAGKQAAQQILDPGKIAGEIVGLKLGQDKGLEQMEKVKDGRPNHTKLDFQKLGNSYSKQDQIQREALKNRYFQRVKSEDENILMKKKQEEQQLKQKEIYEIQERRRREEENNRRQQQSGTAQGKTRKSIFSSKKIAKREQTEVKPSSGKQ